MGKPKDPDYWKKWRAKNPAYRERERKRLAARRANGERPDRSKEYRNRRVKERAAQAVQERLETEARAHPLLEEATAYVRKRVRRDGRTAVYSDYFEECVAEVLLALVAGKTANSGFTRAYRHRRKWYEHNLTGWPDDAGLEGRRATR